MSADREVSEVEDTGDFWLAFCALFVVGAIAAFVVLNLFVSFYWAIAGAVPVGVGVGRLSGRSRPMRKIISELVQLLLG